MALSSSGRTSSSFCVHIRSFLFLCSASPPLNYAQHEEECADFPAHHEQSVHSPGARPCEGTGAINLGHGR